MTQMKNKYVEEGVSVQNSKNTRHFEAVPWRGMGAASRCGWLCVLGPGLPLLALVQQPGRSCSLIVSEPAVMADDRAEFQVI